MQKQNREVGQQLELSIEFKPESRTHTLRLNTLMAVSEEDSTKFVSAKQPWYKISSAVAVAALFLIIVASFGFDQPDTSVPENFKGQYSSPATPIARNFPDTEFPAPGAKLQLGIFSKLQGAESMQTKLSSLGLRPHIEKRQADTGTLYAVILGPLDRQGHQQILGKLKKNDLSYFQTEWQNEVYSTNSGS